VPGSNGHERRSEVAVFYLRAGLKEEKAIGAVLFQLYTQTIREDLWTLALPGFAEGSLRQFANHYDSPWAVGVIDPITSHWIGYGTIFAILGSKPNRRADVSYCFFRDYHGSDVLRVAARKAAEMWFRDAGIQTLWGAALVDNPLAINFARHLGFVVGQELPRFFVDREGAAGDARLMYLTREMMNVNPTS
jgi:RimJ/RimL family protein N-acetyltransferase